MRRHEPGGAETKGRCASACRGVRVRFRVRARLRGRVRVRVRVRVRAASACRMMLGG